MRKLHLVSNLAPTLALALLLPLATLVPAAHACGNDAEHQMPLPMPDPIREVINGEVYTHTRGYHP